MTAEDLQRHGFHDKVASAMIWAGGWRRSDTGGAQTFDLSDLVCELLLVAPNKHFGKAYGWPAWPEDRFSHLPNAEPDSHHRYDQNLLASALAEGAAPASAPTSLLFRSEAGIFRKNKTRDGTGMGESLSPANRRPPEPPPEPEPPEPPGVVTGQIGAPTFDSSCELEEQEAGMYESKPTPGQKWRASTYAVQSIRRFHKETRLSRMGSVGGAVDKLALKRDDARVADTANLNRVGQMVVRLQEEDTAAAQALQILIFATIVVSIAETIASGVARAVALIPAAHFRGVEIFVTVVFTIELMMRYYTYFVAGHRLSFFKKPFNIVDMVAALPLYVEFSARTGSTPCI